MTPKGTNNLQNLIESGCVKQTKRYWSNTEAHEKTYPVKQAAVFSQKVNPAVVQMIAEMITEIDNVKKTHLNICKDSTPDPNDRAYFPMHDEEAVWDLKHSKVWKDHPCVQQRLSTTSHSISQVPTYEYNYVAGFLTSNPVAM